MILCIYYYFTKVQAQTRNHEFIKKLTFYKTSNEQHMRQEYIQLVLKWISLREEIETGLTFLVMGGNSLANQPHPQRSKRLQIWLMFKTAPAIYSTCCNSSDLDAECSITTPIHIYKVLLNIQIYHSLRT